MIRRRRVVRSAAVAASSLPAWYSGMAVDTWATVPGGTLAASGVGWSGTAPGGTGNYSEVLNAWGGSILNTKGVYVGAAFVAGPFMVFFGGGHDNYGGNEVYAFGPLDSDSAAWRRLRDPTISAPVNVNADGSGNPVSRHTYCSLVYIGNGSNNYMMTYGNSFQYSDSGGSGDCRKFDFTVASPNSNTPWSALATADGGIDVAEIDTSTGIVWAHLGNRNSIANYTVATNTHDFGDFLSPTFTSYSAGCAFDTSRGLFAIYGDGGLNFYRASVGPDYYVPTTTGTAPNSGGRRAMIYDPVDDRFVVWDSGGKKLWFLTPPASLPYSGGNAWTWSSTTPGTGSTPGAQSPQGTFSKFRLMNQGGMRAYVLCNVAAQNVFAYRPASAT